MAKRTTRIIVFDLIISFTKFPLIADESIHFNGFLIILDSCSTLTDDESNDHCTKYSCKDLKKRVNRVQMVPVNQTMRYVSRFMGECVSIW